MAYKHGSETGGWVTGNFGFAPRMTFVNVASELPSNGRYHLGKHIYRLTAFGPL